MPKVSRQEQETIIIFNSADSLATIFTYDQAWKKRLESLGCKCICNNGWGAKEYEIDKKRIPMPRNKRVLSAQRKEELGNRLRELSKVRKLHEHKEKINNNGGV